MPRPPGATVELRYATGTEPELIRLRGLLDGVCAVEFPYPKDRFAGHGIVICGGGEKYLPSVYVLVRLLRHLRCRLPIEVWHLGQEEMPEAMRKLLEGLGAVCVDGLAMRRIHPARRLGGWELKCYALLHSTFAEVLLLDADNCPVQNPEFLFTTSQYREHGAIFWPDYTRFAKGQAVWLASGIRYRDQPEFESGQIVVDKARCWRALNVAMHLNEHSDWWYRVIHGDKDTYHLAWRKIGQSYAMTEWDVEPLEATMLQHDFDGKLLFQHRNFAKWSLDDNRRIPGFRLEKQCLQFIAELRAQWTPGLPLWARKWEPSKAPKPLHTLAAQLCRASLDYVRTGHGTRPLEFRPDGTIGTGAAKCERWWDLRLVKTAPGSARTVQLEVFGQHGLTFRARPVRGGGWDGAWVAYERSRVTLRPVAAEGKQAKSGKFGRPGGRNGPKAAKTPVFHVPKCKQNVREAVRGVPKPKRNARKPMPNVPKSQQNGRSPIQDAPKRPRNGHEPVREVAEHGTNGRKAAGNTPKPGGNIRKPVRDEAKRRWNHPSAITHTGREPRNGRKAAGDAFNLNDKPAPLPAVRFAKANGTHQPARKDTSGKTNGQTNQP